jgi:hypothetical protein
MTDTNFFDEMVNSSQELNKSYGYLWWLNGKENYMIPQSQFVFNGSMFPNAPDDMIAALGKNGQFINVIPSENMDWIRMGDAPDESLISFTLNNEICEYLNDLVCEPLAVEEQTAFESNVILYPSPSSGVLQIESPYQNLKYSISNHLGQLIQKGIYTDHIDVSKLNDGSYFIELSNHHETTVVQFQIKK